MFTYSRLAKRPSIFKSFTGLEVSEFDSLYSKTKPKYSEFEEKRLFRKDRKRDIGAGRPFKLPLKDRLLMLLVYYRLYTTSILAGYLFDLDQRNVLRNIRYLEPLVGECLPLPKKVYERTRRARTLEEVEECFPGFIAIIDSMEQEIPRPKEDKKKRKTHYSFRKGRHTVKTQLTVNENGLIIHKTNHYRGRRHDYDIFKQNHPDIPKEVLPAFDLGYYGVKSDFKELNPLLIPYKRNRWNPKDLTPKQKKFNKKLSKVRVVVEHTISRLKKFRIMGEEFRNRLRHYDIMSNIVSGLVNLRIVMVNNNNNNNKKGKLSSIAL